MKVVRGILGVVILANLALILVFLEARATRLRYELARKQDAIRILMLENRTLLLSIARDRRHEELERRAAEFGLELKVETP